MSSIPQLSPNCHYICAWVNAHRKKTYGWYCKSDIPSLNCFQWIEVYDANWWQGTKTFGLGHMIGLSLSFTPSINILCSWWQGSASIVPPWDKIFLILLPYLEHPPLVKPKDLQHCSGHELARASLAIAPTLFSRGAGTNFLGLWCCVQLQQYTLFLGPYFL